MGQGIVCAAPAQLWKQQLYFWSLIQGKESRAPSPVTVQHYQCLKKKILGEITNLMCSSLRRSGKYNLLIHFFPTSSIGCKSSVRKRQFSSRVSKEKANVRPQSNDVCCSLSVFYPAFSRSLPSKRLCFPQRRFLFMEITSGSQVQEEQNQASKSWALGLGALLLTHRCFPSEVPAEAVDL